MELNEVSFVSEVAEPVIDSVKRLSPIFLLVGAILSIADPITDILTLVEFYRTDHKTWFVVGLTFVILPCLAYSCVFLVWADGKKTEEYSLCPRRKCIQACLCGFHPFSAALMQLEGFVFCLKKGQVDAVSAGEEEERLQMKTNNAVLVESVLESVPQTILQLYAMSVQNEPVELIQIISLPVSLLSLARAFIILDKITCEGMLSSGVLKMQHTVLIYVAHVFLLSSRVFAITYFTITFKWWVIAVLLFHIFLIVAASLTHERSCIKVLVSTSGCLVYWLTDFAPLLAISDGFVTELKRMLLVSQALFVVENTVMVLLYYYSDQSNTWYSLPVTVCVCVFSVIGAIMRVTHFHVLFKEHQTDGTVNPQANNNDNSSHVEEPRV